MSMDFVRTLIQSQTCLVVKRTSAGLNNLPLAYAPFTSVYSSLEAGGEVAQLREA